MEMCWLQMIIMGLILALPILLKTSRIFRYYFKIVICYGGMMTIGIFSIPITMFKPRNVDNMAYISKAASFLDRLLGIKWDIRGLGYLEKQQACIIVANHQSCLDLLGLLRVWPSKNNHKCTVIVKKELYYTGAFGLASWLCGAIFIDRAKPEEAKATLEQAIDNIKTNKIKLWIFPEGTRHNDGKIHPFKRGAFNMAINSQLPIVPVVFSSHYFLTKEYKRFEKEHIIATVLPPISTKGLNPDDIGALIKKTQNTMSEVFDSTSNELKPTFSTCK